MERKLPLLAQGWGIFGRQEQSGTVLTETNKQRANFGQIAHYQYCADLEEMLYITVVTDECEQAGTHGKLKPKPFFFFLASVAQNHKTVL